MAPEIRCWWDLRGQPPESLAFWETIGLKCLQAKAKSIWIPPDLSVSMLLMARLSWHLKISIFCISAYTSSLFSVRIKPTDLTVGVTRLFVSNLLSKVALFVIYHCHIPTAWSLAAPFASYLFGIQEPRDRYHLPVGYPRIICLRIDMITASSRRTLMDNIPLAFVERSAETVIGAESRADLETVAEEPERTSDQQIAQMRGIPNTQSLQILCLYLHLPW